jgi:hypothetical protein
MVSVEMTVLASNTSLPRPKIPIPLCRKSFPNRHEARAKEDKVNILLKVSRQVGRVTDSCVLLCRRGKADVTVEGEKPDF